MAKNAILGMKTGNAVATISSRMLNAVAFSRLHVHGDAPGEQGDLARDHFFVSESMMSGTAGAVGGR